MHTQVPSEYDLLDIPHCPLTGQLYLHCSRTRLRNHGFQTCLYFIFSYRSKVWTLDSMIGFWQLGT